MPRGPYRRNAVAQATPSEEPAIVTEAPVSARAAETRRERRRRDDGDLDRMAGMKLGVSQEIQDQLKREGKVFRWILDTTMASAEANDWDRVPGVEPVQANPMAGTDERLVLCSKYRDWHEDDQRRDEQLIDEREAAMMAGQVRDGSRSSEGLRVPDRQANRITRERGL